MKIKLFALATLTLLVASTPACKKQQSPVGEFVAVVNTLCDKCENATEMLTFEELSELTNAGDEIARNNADYILTDEDKKAISEAMYNLVVQSEKMNLRLRGITADNEEAAKRNEFYKASIEAAIQKAVKFGDLCGNSNTPPIENEIIEETINPADSIAVGAVEITD